MSYKRGLPYIREDYILAISGAKKYQCPLTVYLKSLSEYKQKSSLIS